MDGRRIDWLARLMARGANRRSALKNMAVGTLGGAALVQTKTSRVTA